MVNHIKYSKTKYNRTLQQIKSTKSGVQILSELPKKLTLVPENGLFSRKTCSLHCMKWVLIISRIQWTKILELPVFTRFLWPRVNYCGSSDFTYLFLENHKVRYNCTIIDLHDRSVVASITERHITSDLAIRTLQKALESQPAMKGELILHSDQGSQFTSKAFVEFCESVHVTQSMSKAGYPYDNAPMERYFNTLKSELIYLYEYDTEEALYQAVEEFAYVEYNHVRPHSFNGYLTPYQARIA